jgi:hypothetical protein
MSPECSACFSPQAPPPMPQRMPLMRGGAALNEKEAQCNVKCEGTGRSSCRVVFKKHRFLVMQNEGW